MSIFWQKSRKGNEYTEINKKHCVVGEDRYGRPYAVVDGEFLQRKFSSIEEAKAAVCKQVKEKPKFDLLAELRTSEDSND
jgi:hypothetical protein